MIRSLVEFHEKHPELLDEKLRFSNIDKGTAAFSATVDGRHLYCSIAHNFISEYEFGIEESLRDLIEAEHVTVIYDGKYILGL